MFENKEIAELSNKAIGHFRQFDKSFCVLFACKFNILPEYSVRNFYEKHIK